MRGKQSRFSLSLVPADNPVVIVQEMLPEIGCVAMVEGTLFGTNLISPEPFFRPHCDTCGSRMTCNGCSNCGACNHEEKQG